MIHENTNNAVQISKSLTLFFNNDETPTNKSALELNEKGFVCKKKCQNRIRKTNENCATQSLLSFELPTFANRHRWRISGFGEAREFAFFHSISELHRPVVVFCYLLCEGRIAKLSGWKFCLIRHFGIIMIIDSHNRFERK